MKVGVEGASSSLTYHVSDSVNFAIDDAGVIYTLRQLDHESTGGHYTLKVTAEEQGDGWQWPKPAAKVNIQVTDAPEAPHFDSEHYQFTVSEFARTGTCWKVQSSLTFHPNYPWRSEKSLPSLGADT
ncbi:hypothetical protein E2C01_044730 [Portunus trituberculatus]|uniref:Cadherin domain-containing protein n=1 Tax=Portunus trituberculatus TaxID=210409 RepID=A0A5B7FZ53_PORTR|nr:hypothetical protein [Portunus trituberculatus]